MTSDLVHPGTRTPRPETRADVRRAPRGWVPALSLAALHLALALALFNPQLYTGGDNALYISLARALATEGAYIDLFDPATPPHTQVPPAFPLLLALAMSLGLDSLIALKLVVVGFSASAVSFSYLWLRAKAGARIAAVGGVSLALSPGVAFWSHWVLSDVPFWAFTMIALWGLERRAGKVGGWSTGLALCAAGIAFFTRPAGLPLVIAVALWLGIQRRWRPVAGFVAVLLPLALAWSVRSEILGGSPTLAGFWLVDPYNPSAGAAGFADIASRIAENTRRYTLFRLPSLLIVGAPLVSSAVLIYLFSVLLTGAAIFGWVRSLSRLGPSELFLPLYLGLFLVWPPVWADDRFLLPVLPLLLGYAGISLRSAASRIEAPAARLPLLLLPLLFVVNNLPGYARLVASQIRCTRAYLSGDLTACVEPGWAAFLDVGRAVRTGLPEGSVFFSRKPSLFYLVSGHRGRLYPLEADPGRFFAAADAAGVRYLVFDQVSPLTARYVHPAVMAHPERFCVRPELSNPHVWLLEIRGAGAAGSHAAGDAGKGSTDIPRCSHPVAAVNGREQLAGEVSAARERSSAPSPRSRRSARG